MLTAIERLLNIPVFPNQDMLWHYDEKVSEFYALRHRRAHARNMGLLEPRRALAWTRTARFPVVFKLSPGSYSANVIRIESARQAKALIRRMFGRGLFPNTLNEFRFRFIPRSPGAAVRRLNTRGPAARMEVWRTPCARPPAPSFTSATARP